MQFCQHDSQTPRVALHSVVKVLHIYTCIVNVAHRGAANVEYVRELKMPLQSRRKVLAVLLLAVIGSFFLISLQVSDKRSVLSHRSSYSDETVLDKARSIFPRVFIIGFAKSGTKALYEALKMHPQLNGPLKETRYFSLHYQLKIASYLKLFTTPLPSQLNIEKSPDYVTSKGVARRISTTALQLGVQPSSLKFIVVLRNPVARSVSEYLEWNYYRITNGKRRLRPFSQLVLNSQMEVVKSLTFVNNSLYAYHIDAGGWLTQYNKSQFCFVNGDQFRIEPSSEIRKLEKCIGVNPYFKEENFVYKKESDRYCLKDVTGEVICLGPGKGRKHPPIPRAVVDKLKKFYHQWNERLYNFIGESYGWEESDLY